jgi:hypothetical protein
MNPATTNIGTAADGLLFISESVPIELAAADSPLPQLVLLAGTAAPVETQSLDYFFRNHTRADAAVPDGEQATTQRFRALQAILQRTLTDIVVYRIGTVQVQAFIVGRLPDGRYAGLRTLLIET